MKRIIQKSSDGKKTTLDVSNKECSRRMLILQAFKDPFCSQRIMSMKDQLPTEDKNLLDELSKIDEIYIMDEELGTLKEIQK